MVEDSIVRETVVAAPVQRVWEVLTQAEHVGRWFGADEAEIDLRPGGSFVMTWAEHGVGLARVERVEEPTLFSFRWALEPGLEPEPGEETLVEFTLVEKGDGTLLRVVESGFSKLDRPAEKQEWHRERNVDGWRQVLEAVAGHFLHRSSSAPDDPGRVSSG
ncbi:MAG: SRPBCC domain-containing protein [Pseudonocardia sp.]